MRKSLITFAFCLFTFTLFSGCGSQSRTEKKIQQVRAAAPDFEGNLVFNDATLEQADPQGRPLWKVKAKQAVYTKDKKIARIQKPTGDLFQDGKLVLQIAAESGEVQEDGQKIFLKGQIVATDPRNAAVFRGNELEWRPKEDLLLVRNNFTGSHPKLEASGTEGRYLSRSQQMELFGQIVATSKEPVLKMTTEHLIWQIPQKILIADRRIQINKYKGKTVSDRVVGNQSQLNLETKIAILKQNVSMNSTNPPVQITGNSVVWNYDSKIVTADQPVKIWHQKEQTTAKGDRGQVDMERKVATLQQNVAIASVTPPMQMTGNSVVWNYETKMVVSEQPLSIVQQKEQVTLSGDRGQLDLERKVAVVNGNTQGFATRNQAKLFANQMVWDDTNQQVQAEGNVIYQQVNPPFNLTGTTAKGKLQDQTVVVTSTNSGRVVTEIIPGRF